ncbi:hypothetical protein FD514_01180 [Cutibacterium acnes]|nr:hypothetical protein COH12_03190 [Cutibacterium acnes]TLG24880.1 hypothetical protein FD516_03180 [Cutibacterium acnes]TLG25351.1 hypothetical protein FD514_01180 [Cutibacterium acnes]TLG26659.1 hypothetical protein FD517_09830 [Cutibacterium acnes]TMT42092.1 hypothetical protein DMX98_09840 [Cutibacterium acnes]
MKITAIAVMMRAMTTTSATIRHFGPPGCALSPAWVVELFDGVDPVEGSWRRGDRSVITVMSSRACEDSDSGWISRMWTVSEGTDPDVGYLLV